MTTEIVYVVPGLAESVLSLAGSTPLTGGIVYPDIPTLMLGGFGRLRLAPDGVSPGPPDGVACVADSALGPWVIFPTLQIYLQAQDDGYQLTPWAWDWRQSILTAGDTLAAAIAAATPAGQRVSIVGHSAGGLVARRAWSTLAATGQQGLIRRIVTLGTPHYGSYAIVDAWSGANSFLRLLWEWNYWAGQTVAGISSVTGYVSWTLAQVLSLSMTWPALYEVLPVVGAPDAGGDPSRAALFTSTNWGGVAIPSQAWLTHALSVYQPWALSAASMPPDNVLVCVAGGYRTTASGLVYPAELGTPAALGSTSDGDDTVTRASAQLVGSTAYRVNSDHSSLYPQACADGGLLTYLGVVISPTPPPPAEQVSTQPISIVLSDPPGGPNPPGIATWRMPAGSC